MKDTQIIVNRTAFHQAFLSELEEYLSALRNGVDQDLRAKMASKMNLVASGGRSSISELDKFRTKVDFIAEGKFQN
jgi:hypothetical protein